MSTTEKFIPQQHWEPYMSFTRAMAYMNMGRELLTRVLEDAEIRPVPHLKRYKRADLDNLDLLLRERAKREYKRTCERLNEIDLEIDRLRRKK